MGAPSYEVLHEFEDAIEDAAKSIFVAQGFTNCYRTRQYVAVEAPRVEVVATLGAPTGHKQWREAVRREVFDQYTFTLSVRVVTGRKEDTDSGDHRSYRGKVRWLMSELAQKFTAANLPYYDILVLNPAGTQTELIDEQENDVSAINYSGVLAIRASAWPD
jgi:hypothetical protein